MNFGKRGLVYLVKRKQRSVNFILNFSKLHRSSSIRCKMASSSHFSARFIKIISHYKKIGYNINVLQQTACLVVNPIMVGNFAFLFNCMQVGRTSDSMTVLT